MSKLSYFPLWISDWRGSVSRATMTLAERGCYLEALALQYDLGSIPSDMDVLAKLLAVTRGELDVVWPRVSKKFVPHPKLKGELVNPVASEQARKVAEQRKNASERGKKGANARWGKNA